MHVGAAGARDVLRGFFALTRALASGSRDAEAELESIVSAHEPWADAEEALRLEHRERAWSFDGQRLPVDAQEFGQLAEFADRLTKHGVSGLEFAPALPAADWLRAAIQLVFAPAEATRAELVERLTSAGVIHVRLLAPAPVARSPARSVPGSTSRRAAGSPADAERHLRLLVVARQGILGLDGCRGLGPERCRWIVRAVVEAVLAEPVLVPWLRELLSGNPTDYGRAARAAIYGVLVARHDGLSADLVLAVGVAGLLRRVASGEREPAAAFARVLALGEGGELVDWLACAMMPAAGGGAEPRFDIAERTRCAEAFEELATASPDGSIEALGQRLVAEQRVPVDWVQSLEAALAAV